jgi:hypothetical protein
MLALAVLVTACARPAAPADLQAPPGSAGPPHGACEKGLRQASVYNQRLLDSLVLMRQMIAKPSFGYSELLDLTRTVAADLTAAADVPGLLAQCDGGGAISFEFQALYADATQAARPGLRASLFDPAAQRADAAQLITLIDRFTAVQAACQALTAGLGLDATGPLTRVTPPPASSTPDRR